MYNRLLTQHSQRLEGMMSNKKCPNCGYELDSWNDCVSVNNILECPECEGHFELKAIPLNQPQLTIPKSIADELDKTTLLDFVDEIKSYDDLSYKLFDYVKPFESDIKDNWYEIFLAYLSPLTRDLVKVVEG